MTETFVPTSSAPAAGNSLDDPLDRKIAFVDSLKPELTPEPLRVYRDGPRFYAAWVTDGERDFQIKDVIHNPDVNSDPANLDSPRSHMRTEIEMLRFFQARVGAMPKQIAPDLLLSNNGDAPWYVTSHLPEDDWLGYEETPFFFRPEKLAGTDPRSIFDSIAALQALTNEPDVPEWITLDQRAEKYGMGGSDWSTSFLAERSGVPREEVDAAYAAAQAARAGMPMVLRHGEVYPQHIFVAKDEQGVQTARFIDWENAKLGDPYSDHAAVWLRSFSLDNPEWQAAYYQLVSSQPGFNQDAWNGSVFLAAIGNFRYLSEVPQVKPDRQQAAVEFCRAASLQAGKALSDAGTLRGT